MFFVFEGIDGAGKSTQLNLFAAWLRLQGSDVITCQDPGSTELGEQLRGLLLGRHSTPIHMRTEMMMFSTARTQLVEQVVKPALAKNQTVVLDRFVMSTVVYQGHAGKLNPDDIWAVNRIATDGVWPDITFVVDLPVEIAMGRLGKSLDRVESRGIDYLQSVRDGFRKEAERWPDRVELLDGMLPPEQIQQEIQSLTNRYLARKADGRN
jgi:dTMP kinase